MWISVISRIFRKILWVIDCNYWRYAPQIFQCFCRFFQYHESFESLFCFIQCCQALCVWSIYRFHGQWGKISMSFLRLVIYNVTGGSQELPMIFIFKGSYAYRYTYHQCLSATIIRDHRIALTIRFPLDITRGKKKQIPIFHVRIRCPREVVMLICAGWIFIHTWCICSCLSICKDPWGRGNAFLTGFFWKVSDTFTTTQCFTYFWTQMLLVVVVSCEWTAQYCMKSCLLDSFSGPEETQRRIENGHEWDVRMYVCLDSKNNWFTKKNKYCPTLFSVLLSMCSPTNLSQIHDWGTSDVCSCTGVWSWFFCQVQWFRFSGPSSTLILRIICYFLDETSSSRALDLLLFSSNSPLPAFSLVVSQSQTRLPQLSPVSKADCLSDSRRSQDHK